MSKTYILQKDLPDNKRGAKFYKHPLGNYYVSERNFNYMYENRSNDCHYVDDATYHMNIVENNSEWFVEAVNDDWELAFYEYDINKEQRGMQVDTNDRIRWLDEHFNITPKNKNKSNDSFQWTDEVVLELLNAHRSSEQVMSKWFYLQKTIDAFKKFKQSHTPKPQAENRIKTFPEAMAEADKINPQPRYKIPQAENKPDWVVIGFTGFDGKLYHNTNGVFSHISERDTITSVKRLSDGEVFSVGDEVDCTEAMDSFKRQKIEKFAIASDGHMRVDCAGVNCSIQYIQKPQPQKEEQRIEVKRFLCSNVVRPTYEIELSRLLPETGRPNKEICEGIEQVLNDDEHFFLNKSNYDKLPPYLKIYNQQQVDAMCEDAFNAAKIGFPAHDRWVEEYKTYEDYKNKSDKK